MVRNLICETGSIREGFFDLIPRFAVLEYAARKLGRLEVALRDLFVFPLERVRIRGRVGLGAELVRVILERCALEDSANGLRSLNETLIDDCGRCRLDWNRELFHRRLNRDTVGNLSTLAAFCFRVKGRKK